MHKAKCKSCGQIIVSERPGHFASCDCGKSFIDTDRWFPERIRLGGDAELLQEDEEGQPIRKEQTDE